VQPLVAIAVLGVLATVVLVLLVVATVVARVADRLLAPPADRL
jgi:hypothetical protein